MLMIDGHLDLAMNALYWDRDLRRTVHQIREDEAGMEQKGRAAGTVAFPEMREAEIAISLATVIARVRHDGAVRSGYRTHEIAYAHAQGQLAYYKEMERQGDMKMLRSWPEVEQHLSAWNADPENAPLAYVLCMEGADPIVDPAQVELWWNDGLRVISLAHYGPSAYAMGTASPGPLTDKAAPLLKEMEQAGMVLDVTHLSDDSFWGAVELFNGNLLASHSNCRALVDGDRQLTDDMLKVLFERDAVIGAVLDAWMLENNWERGVTTNERVTMNTLVDHIDHVCQLAGNSLHAAIGTDLDGGYGIEQTPNDLDTIVDMQKVPDLLRQRGYSEDDVENVMFRNWLRLLERALPG